MRDAVIVVRGSAAHVEDIVEAARDLGDRVLRDVADAERDVGVALLTVHVDTGGVWLLLHRWEEGESLRHRRFHAPVGDPARFAGVSAQHRGPCVWDLAVRAHERQAWIAHVLANLGGPDLGGCLADGLTATL